MQGVGSLTSTPDVRQFLAKSSHSYACDKCGPIKDLLAPRPPYVPQPAIIQKDIVEPVLKQKDEVQIERKLSAEEKPNIQAFDFKRNYPEDQRNFIK